MMTYASIPMLMLACLFDRSSAFRLSRLLFNVDSRFVREAEFKHARAALLAVPTLGIMSTMGVEEPVKWLSSQPVDTQLVFFSTAAVLESASLVRLGPNFSLKNGLVPGDFFNGDDKVSTDLELMSGRVAMLVAAGMLVSGV
jgi:hypothetical protein